MRDDNTDGVPVFAWLLIISGLLGAGYFMLGFNISVQGGGSGRFSNLHKLYLASCGVIVSMGIELTGVLVLVGSWIASRRP